MKRLLGKKSDKKSSSNDYDENPYAQPQVSQYQAQDAYSRQPSYAPSYSSAAPSYSSAAPADPWTARPGASGPTGARAVPGRNSPAAYSNAAPYAPPNAPADSGYGSNSYNASQYGQGQNSLNSSYNRGYGASSQSSEAYGGYGAPRELTEEEKDEEVVQDMNREANNLREDSVQITRRGVAMAYQMLEVGTGTGERLDEQTHRFENMKSNLHTGNVQTRRAAEQTKHLQRVNGSMWNPANYIGKKERAAQAQQHMENGTLDLSQQEEIRKERFDNAREIEEHKNSFARKGQLLGNSGSRTKNYNKFLLEADDMEQRDKEDELDANLDEMSFVLSKVKLVADANLKKVDKHIDTIGDITDMSHNLEAKVRRVNNELGTFK